MAGRLLRKRLGLSKLNSCQPSDRLYYSFWEVAIPPFFVDNYLLGGGSIILDGG